ncbi:MAG TPA: class I SAM-dependent methyltransferase [Usitatibacter sp.]|nr:class I SAM-dependent methyltransferase [Usitatibacter sp.]
MSRGFFRSLAREAAARYPARDRYARHFAYGKLTGDPVFEYLLEAGLVRDAAPLLDIGCGQGLLAALLAAAHDHHARGDWPAAWPAPARPSGVRGIDLSRRDVGRAHAALPDATWIAGDMRAVDFGCAGTVVMLDVLHYLEPHAQDDVLRRVRAALQPGGIAIVRVGDANGSWRFRATVASDRLVTALRGHGFARVHCHPVTAWIEALRRHGLEAHATPMSRGTPFANTLLLAGAVAGAGLC